MAQFPIAEIEVVAGKVPCVVVLGGKRDPEIKSKITRAADARWPHVSKVILWDAPGGQGYGFDGPFEMTSFFSSMTPERVRSLINGSLEV